MAQRGEILNNTLLKKLAARLKIGGVSLFPSKMNLDEVMVTASLIDSFSTYDFQAKSLTAVSLAGVSSFAGNEVGDSSLGFTTPLIDTVGGKECRVFGNEFSLNFDAAGAVAFNGKLVRWSLLLTDPTGGPVCAVNQGYLNIATGKTIYRFNLRGNWENPQTLGNNVSQASTWRGWVPKGCLYAVQVVSNDGTNFPANTTLNKFITGVLVEGNTQPPE